MTVIRNLTSRRHHAAKSSRSSPYPSIKDILHVTNDTSSATQLSADPRTASGVNKLTKRVGFISTGGTIASIAVDEFDFMDYNATDERVSGQKILDKSGISEIFHGIRPVIYDFEPPIDSTAIQPQDWFTIARACNAMAQKGYPKEKMHGIVIGHGTASLEETAWVLSLVLDLDIPVVVTGCMRPLNGKSSEASANLLAAFRVASHEFPRDTHTHSSKPGVFVVINDEIHSPRTITKTHTLRVGAFQSPWRGPIGYIDGDTVNITSQLLSSSTTKFSPDLLRDGLPRVDIVYSHIGADGTMVRACVAAGARGIVSAGFGPGLGTPSETAAFGEAIRDSNGQITVVQSSRLGAGVVVDSKQHRKLGIIAGNDLNPQKARILLALCLAHNWTHEQIKRTFELA
ncbi:asparaginase [Colletotrichum kahawae]|uniref:asparaginase n=1 Tax=Colletotrichum kahawae TaxID=34407 RepID=A0AAD9YK48_COLKA|nr:asparaginase [Colletotrichum kahawae]